MNEHTVGAWFKHEMRENSTCLVCSSEQVNERLDASTLADGGLVIGYLGKFSQGSHYIYQNFFRLIGQQANQGLQGFVLLKPFKGGEEGQASY